MRRLIHALLQLRVSRIVHPHPCTSCKMLQCCDCVSTSYNDSGICTALRSTVAYTTDWPNWDYSMLRVCLRSLLDEAQATTGSSPSVRVVSSTRWPVASCRKWHWSRSKIENAPLSCRHTDAAVSLRCVSLQTVAATAHDTARASERPVKTAQHKRQTNVYLECTATHLRLGLRSGQRVEFYMDPRTAGVDDVYEDGVGCGLVGLEKGIAQSGWRRAESKRSLTSRI